MSKMTFRNLVLIGLLITNLVFLIQTRSMVKEMRELFTPEKSDMPSYIIMEPVPNV